MVIALIVSLISNDIRMANPSVWVALTHSRQRVQPHAQPWDRLAVHVKLARRHIHHPIVPNAVRGIQRGFFPQIPAQRALSHLDGQQKKGAQPLAAVSFSPATAPISRSTNRICKPVIGCLNTSVETAKVPAAPMPVHTA
jgi:hypothetical protein